MSLKSEAGRQTIRQSWPHGAWSFTNICAASIFSLGDAI